LLKPIKSFIENNYLTIEFKKHYWPFFVFFIHLNKNELDYSVGENYKLFIKTIKELNEKF
jgi:hypothetical protein